MQLIESIDEMQKTALALRAGGKRIAFVPTMGSLHEGHLSLIDTARQHGDVTVASIFVNPTQFGPNEDFEKYPRNLDDDLALLRERSVDIAFCPTRASIYPPGYSTYVSEERLSTGLCGVSRPQFFRGVCTVVNALFNIVQPTVSVFGQKDAQQAAVIKKMVRDLHIPVEIVVGPTVREADGLAMSSRNKYLSAAQRTEAASISKALKIATAMVSEKGMRSVDRVMAEVTHIITQHRRMRVIYVVVVDPETMEPLREINPGRSLVAVAAWCDEVRLIDNVIV